MCEMEVLSAGTTPGPSSDKEGRLNPPLGCVSATETKMQRKSPLLSEEGPGVVPADNTSISHIQVAI
jgi:hypothetical protein